MALNYDLQPITHLAGVQPAQDKTPVLTQHYTYADKIRFIDNTVRKIGGYTAVDFDYCCNVDGTSRSLYSEIINGKYYSIIGTNTKLYSLVGSSLTNISPLLTTGTAIADSLDTHYDTLSSNPFTTVSGSPLVTVTDADAALYQVGDTVVFSGATGFAGLSSGDLNGDALIREIGSGEYVINVGTNATSSTSGGGASVIRTSGLVTVNATAHDQNNGDRVKIDGATTFGGITTGEINIEFIIRNSTTNTFDVMTLGEATSSVSGGGGGSTEYFEEIPIGDLNERNVTGYGAGLYGTGLYGTARTSSSARSLPRIWFLDRYGETIIATAGNQTGVYQWGVTNDTAPELVANAPTSVNYAFVSNNILVLFGEGGVENRITGSNQGDITNYTSSSINQVFRDDVEGAGRLISHCPVEDYNLIFTENKTYKFRYIGLPFVWEITNIDETIGIIAPMARVSAKGIAFWMGQDNFYMYRSGTVEVIPANSQRESTVLNYVFNNMNWGQKSKFFAWFNKAFNEVWFHYASATSNECDRVAVVNILDWTWTIHTFDRTAAEYPNVKLKKPRLINVGSLYQHENGNNADGEPLQFTLASNKRFYNKNNVNITAIVPDNYTSYDIDFNIKGFLYPQSTQTTFNDTQVVATTDERIALQNSARFHQYTWSGNILDQAWSMGQWFEEYQKGSPY